jgi:hypothetical protein
VTKRGPKSDFFAGGVASVDAVMGSSKGRGWVPARISPEGGGCLVSYHASRARVKAGGSPPAPPIFKGGAHDDPRPRR